MRFLPCVSGYTNYVSYDKPVDLVNVNCPSKYLDNVSRLQNNPRKLQPYAYIKNKHFDKTRFVISSLPQGTDPDFFSNI